MALPQSCIRRIAKPRLGRPWRAAMGVTSAAGRILLEGPYSRNPCRTLTLIKRDVQLLCNTSHVFVSGFRTSLLGLQPVTYVAYIGSYICAFMKASRSSGFALGASSLRYATS